jgi:diguanylate cyclase (GGDEF)-like protein
MPESKKHLWKKTLPLGAIAAALAVSAALATFRLHDADGTVLGLVSFASVALGIASLCAGTEVPRPRFAMIPLLAGFLVLPAPVAAGIGCIATIAARGAGVAGPRTPGLPSVAALGLVWTALGLAVGRLFEAGEGAGASPWLAPGEGLSIVGLLVLYAVVQLGSRMTRGLLDGRPSPAHPRGDAASGTLELFNVPLAWMLAARIADGAWGEAVALTGLVSGVSVLMSRHARTIASFRRTRAELESRVAELATVHAIAREISSTLEPSRLFELIDRECRKILEVDLFLIALADDENGALRETHRKLRGEAATQGDSEPGGLVAAVARNKAARRVANASPTGPADRRLLQHPRARSGMAAPLVVDGRVTGVIAVESLRGEAYDDHQLGMLMTIAQQAAVAIENARHYHLATTDALTGFHSRDYFFKRLEEEHRRVSRYGGRFAVLMLDVDGFKTINDRSGHLVGDRVLRHLADTVRAKLRDADLPCRYGGDEFCVLLPETGLAGARTIAERIRRAVRDRAVELDGERVRTTVSIGLAMFPDHGSGPLTGLLRNADDALYRAKRSGRDRVVPYAA